MALKNGEQYVESIRKMRPNIYTWGKVIEDVTTNSATRLHVQSVKRSYDLSHDQEKASIYTSKSHLTGDIIHRWNSLMQSAEDVMGNSNMKREQFHQSGTCQGATCAGWTASKYLAPARRIGNTSCLERTGYPEVLQVGKAGHLGVTGRQLRLLDDSEFILNGPVEL